MQYLYLYHNEVCCSNFIELRVYIIYRSYLPRHLSTGSSS